MFLSPFLWRGLLLRAWGGRQRWGKFPASRESIPADGSAAALLRRLMDTRCLSRRAFIFSWNHLIGLNICLSFQAFLSPELPYWFNHRRMSEELSLPFPHSGSWGILVWFVRSRGGGQEGTRVGNGCVTVLHVWSVVTESSCWKTNFKPTKWCLPD